MFTSQKWFLNYVLQSSAEYLSIFIMKGNTHKSKRLIWENTLRIYTNTYVYFLWIVIAFFLRKDPKGPKPILRARYPAKFHPLNSNEWKSYKNNQIQVRSRTAVWTLRRNADFKVKIRKMLKTRHQIWPYWNVNTP